MEESRWRFTGRCWMRLAIALALHAVGTIAAAQLLEHRGGPWCRAGEFPAFIPMPAGVTPRGVVVDKVGNVYVTVGRVLVADNKEHISIWRFTPCGGGPSLVADVGQGTIGGLMVTARGDLYVAMAAGVDRGVWRVDRAGQKQLLPGTNLIFFANGLAFDNRGTLYVTESVTAARIENGRPAGPGGIWRIPRGGQAELWMRDDLLAGTGALGQPVWIGANGIAYRRGDLYVTNTEKGTLLRIPVQDDGTPGVPEVWELQEVEESPLAGIPGFPPPMGDGLVLDVHGNLHVAVLTRSAVVRIDPRDQSQETVAVFKAKWPVGPPPDAPLDFPASLFFGTGKAERTSLFLTNLAMGVKVLPQLPVIGTVPWAGPGLVKIDAGVPGRPMP
jgi:sugar lactone lactonase YvrE